jgi:hypothetical protein
LFKTTEKKRAEAAACAGGTELFLSDVERREIENGPTARRESVKAPSTPLQRTQRVTFKL